MADISVGSAIYTVTIASTAYRVSIQSEPQYEVTVGAAVSGAVAWGNITGALSSQIDLQVALDGKA